MKNCPTCGQELPKDQLRISVDLECNVLITDDTAVFLEPKVAEVAHVLIDKSPGWVNKTSLMDYMYGLENEEPDDKVIDVYICKLRKSMKDTEYSIQSGWNRKFRIVRKELGQDRQKTRSRQAS